MAGLITPLPIMLEDEEDRKRYAAMEPPKTVVCRYGYLRYIAELAYDGTSRPGCGSKLVIRTQRGTELAEMLTSTCANAGCGKSVSRKQMLEYIDRSGGKHFPFSTQGKALRIASVDDLQQQERLDSDKPQIMTFARTLIVEMDLPMKLVEVERLLGGERMIFHYTSNQRVDFRELVRRLAGEYQTRIEMHQVNARDEARLIADYEKCGQHCCCKQFLKVLKPVSMRSAKVQKATLDPAKISGRCGRLMCCLRYEDQTYESLRRRLPNRQARVMTEDGPGVVIDTQILTQLVLVLLDQNQTTAAYPVENIERIVGGKPPEAPEAPEVGSSSEQASMGVARADGGEVNGADVDGRAARPTRPQWPPRSPRSPGNPRPSRTSQIPDEEQAVSEPSGTEFSGEGLSGEGGASGDPQEDSGPSDGSGGGQERRRSRRRRRGRRRGGGGRGPSTDSPPGPTPPPGE